MFVCVCVCVSVSRLYWQLSESGLRRIIFPLRVMEYKLVFLCLIDGKAYVVFIKGFLFNRKTFTLLYAIMSACLLHSPKPAFLLAVRRASVLLGTYSM